MTIGLVTTSDLTGACAGGAALITTLLVGTWGAGAGTAGATVVIRGTLDTAGVVAVTVLNWGTS